MKQISLQNIRKVYGAGASAALAVEDATLQVSPGEFFFLLGPSGCGKTTLLRIIAGLTLPTRGRVLLGGRDVTDDPVERRNTALVFQNYALWPHMTVRENVEFGPKMRGLGRAERRAVAARSLSRVEMADLAGRKPNQLSGGQQQRVALARALAAQPDCLLLDEPLSNLDARLRLHMRQELRWLVKSTGTTAVYVTHDQKEALSMADRVAVMDAGRVVQIGTPEEVYNEPGTHFVADFLGEANFIEGRVIASGPPGVIETPAGRLLAAAGCPAPGGPVCCCVRPERIALLAEPGEADRADTAALSARTLSCVYLGEMRQYLCELGGGEHWKVSTLAGRRRAIEPGQPVTLRVAAEDVCLLPPRSAPPGGGEGSPKEV
jgi:iron(III) transport system ATP-binding protein